MLFNYLGSGMSAQEIIISLLLTVPIILLSLTVHEFAHGYASYKLGDPTAQNMGRLTLNPLKHLDIFGTLAMLCFGIGWAKPVPVNSRYYKNPKRGMAITAFAGPLANLILAFLGVVLHVTFFRLGLYSISSAQTAVWKGVVYQFISNFILLNSYLAVFNLLPIPPFDGSRIAFLFLPDRIYFAIMKYERYIMLALLVLLYMGILSVPFSFFADKIVDGMIYLVDGIWELIAGIF